MDLYLDTEFNGHGGELISLALAAPDGKHWYGIYPPSGPYVPWVQEHVEPWLHAMPGTFLANGLGFLEWRELFRMSLGNYLLSRPGASIYADWPADFEHFLRCLAGPSFEQALNYQCTMHLIQTPPGEPQPKIPHNALSDAIALRDWHKAAVR